MTAYDDNRVEGGKIDAAAAQHRDVVDTEEVGRCDEDARAAPGADVGRLDALEPRVDRHKGCTRFEDAEGRDNPLRTVEAPDRHPVAALDPAGDESCRELAGRLLQLRVSERRRLVD